MTGDAGGCLIYGAYGYLGRMVTRAAKAAGLPITVAGRHPQQILDLSIRHQCPGMTMALDHPDEVARRLRPFQVVINCAAPYRHSAPSLAAACISSETCYIDAAIEPDAVEHVLRLTNAATKLDSAIIPAVGWVGGAGVVLTNLLLNETDGIDAINFFYEIPATLTVSNGLLRDLTFSLRLANITKHASAGDESQVHVEFSENGRPKPALLMPFPDGLVARQVFATPRAATYLVPHPYSARSVALLTMLCPIFGTFLGEMVASAYGILRKENKSPPPTPGFLVTAVAESRSQERSKKSVRCADPFVVTVDFMLEGARRALAGKLPNGLLTAADLADTLATREGTMLLGGPPTADDLARVG